MPFPLGAGPNATYLTVGRQARGGCCGFFQATCSRLLPYLAYLADVLVGAGRSLLLYLTNLEQCYRRPVLLALWSNLVVRVDGTPCSCAAISVP